MASKIEQRAPGRRLLTTLGLAAGVATLAAMSGCCGGAPAHSCKFVEVPKDATPTDSSGDGSQSCGFDICEPGKTYCCLKRTPPVSLSCIPLASKCDGQPPPACSGDDDCVPGSGFHCCGDINTLSTQCLETCSGNPADGTVRICRTSTEFPPDLPNCGQITVGGQNVPACLPPGK